MNSTLRAALIVLIVPALAGAAARGGLESQVVSLVVTTQAYDAIRPWEKKTPETHTVQAVVVEGPFLATTADNVEGATLILAEKHGRPLREPARVVQVDREANLVLLTVDRPGFYADLRPAVLAPSTPTSGLVSTVRWDSGHLEVAASRITRFEVGSTHLGTVQHAFLYVETDLSRGGWGEPVFQEDRLVGVTYSQDGQSAQVVPVDLLRAYLESARSPGGYRELANLELSWQVNRDPVLTRYLGLEGEPHGILVTEVPWGSSACGALYPHDLLLSLDGHPIDATGIYDDPLYGPLEFTEIVIRGHHAGDVIPGVVLRDRKELPVKLTLRPARSDGDLMPVREGGAPPPYVVAGGFVFRELDADYLRSWGKDWQKKAPPFLMTQYDLFRSRQTPTRRRMIILSYVLPAALNLGYGDLEDLPLSGINGREVDSIADVDEAFRHPEGGVQRITFAPNPVRSTAVLDAADFDRVTQSILSDYRIPLALRLPAAPPPDLGGACPDHP